MAGRAGRRGKDKKGSCIIVRSQFEGAESAYHTLNSEVDALNSTFAATYGMVLNLLQRRDLDGSRQLVERSFGSFLMRKEKENRLQKGGLQSNAEKFLEAKKILEGVPIEEITDLNKAMARLKAEGKLLRKLAQIAANDERDELEQMIPFMIPGTTVTVITPSRKVAAVDARRNEIQSLLNVLPAGEKAINVKSLYHNAVFLGSIDIATEMDPVYAVLTARNQVRLVDASHIVRVCTNDALTLESPPTSE